VSQLRRKDQNDKHNYLGQMSVEIQGEYVAVLDVAVSFDDLEKLKLAHISYIDNDEIEAFLYDEENRIIVKYEDYSLHWAVKYRRYKPIFNDEYIYVVRFIEATKPEAHKINMNSVFKQYFYKSRMIRTENADSIKTFSHKDEQKIQNKYVSEINTEIEADSLSYIKNPTSIPVSKLGIHPIIFNCLKSAGYKTMDDLIALIERKGIKGLNNINTLSADKRAEVIDALRKHGVCI